jgi:hypothetical protein
MSLTVSQVYSVRFGMKLPLPQVVQDNIAKLRITAAAYKPVRHAPKHHKYPKHEPIMSDNWRVKSLSNYVSKIKNKDDPDYAEVFTIFNKLSTSNLDKLSVDALEVMKKRDQEFRLRVVALMFNKAITENMFASVMADCASKFVASIPDVQVDLNAQVSTFPALYYMATTNMYPASSDADFDEKVISWMSQKTKRRGYAKFITHLYVRNLVTDNTMRESLQLVIDELTHVANQPKSQETEENVTQFADFLFESVCVLPQTAASLKEIVRASVERLLSSPRQNLPSLGMRTRFKLEDTLKRVQ